MKWIKLWVDGWLDGTLRLDLSPDERALFVDLLALAGRSRFPGIICAGEDVPYPHHILATRLGLDLDFFERTLEKLKLQDRVSENRNGIHIVNWDRYQPSYTKKEGGQKGNQEKSIREKYEST
jgi:hypothetical protein